MPSDSDWYLPDCVSCGTPLSPFDTSDDPHLADAMRARCNSCAKESLGLPVSVSPVQTQYDTGGGRRVVREGKTH